jgi:predicted oxidoreductase
MTVTKIQIALDGPYFSRLAFGLWRLASWGLNDARLLALINSCMAYGITTFDHADIYGDYTCEQIFGRALGLTPSLRDKIQLVTKCGIKLVSANRPAHTIKHYDTSQAHIIASVENSLKMLQTDYLDVLLIHRPDPFMDADEVAGAFTTLRQAGKVLHFGVSNFTPWQFDLLASRLDFPLVTNQVEISVLYLDTLHDGTLDQCQRLGISPMAWSPFGGGRLFDGDDEQILCLRQALDTIGEELGGATPDQVALAWLLAHPARIIPVLGTGKIERVRSAAQATELQLSREQWFSIWTASTGKDVP